MGQGHAMILPPEQGDVYVVLEPMQFCHSEDSDEKPTTCEVGTFITLVSEVKPSQELWKCLTAFGLGLSAYISHRVDAGQLQLVCKSRSKGVV